MNQVAEEGFKMMFSKGNTPRKGSGAESEEEAGLDARAEGWVRPSGRQPGVL